MAQKALVVTCALDPAERKTVADAIGGTAAVVYLSDTPEHLRTEALQAASVLLSRDTGQELRGAEIPLIGHVGLIQFITAGIDFIRLGDLPRNVPVAPNAGASAEPMAEHAAALALAAAKRLFPEHAKLVRGEFDQFRPNRMLAGGVAGILGFGGIGIATARLLKAFGMRVHAINRRGGTSEPVAWMGKPDQLDDLLAASDVLVLCLPLTRKSLGLIGFRELGLMKKDAILINMARGEIIDESALFAHLQANPGFTACIDAWWVEPVRHGEFRMDQPFLSLPNVIGSPHNSASVRGWRHVALQRAVANCRRVLDGLPPHNVIGEDERMA